MEVSTFDENIDPVIKRKKKIQYHKVKGRLNQSRCRTNFVNKSICSENIQNHLNESKCNEKKLVSVKNIQTFLVINRDLAKALQDNKLQLKEAEDKTAEVQLECIKLRSKLNASNSALVKCKCQSINSNTSVEYELLNGIQSALSKGTELCTEYMDSLALNQKSLCEKGVQTESVQTTDFCSQTQISTRSVRIQTSIITNSSDLKTCALAKNKATQTENLVLATKSKLVQCSLGPRSMAKTTLKNPAKESIPSQPIKETKSIPLQAINPAKEVIPLQPIKESKRIPLQAKNPAKEAIPLQPVKEAKRIPLQDISDNRQGNQTASFNTKNKKKEYVTVRPKKKLFKIYEDKDAHAGEEKKIKKSNKTVTISGPKVVRYADENNDSRLRPRRTRPDYTGKQRSKNKRKASKRAAVPPLESILSMLQESLMLSFSQRN